jgi:hypothetical protein
MTIGAGFALDAIRRARDLEREMMHRRARVRPRLRSGEGGQDELEYACFFVCGSCGLLADPPATDAFRDEASARPRLPACGHCGAEAWLDLRNVNNAQALRETEERLRHDPPASVRTRVGAASGAAGVAAGGAAALALQVLFAPALGPLAVVAATTAGLAALAARAIAGNSLSRMLLTREPVGPARWRRALPLVDTESPIVDRRSGPARSSAEPLIAPISGRPCLAYEVGVVFDAEGDAYPPMWILREERSRAIEIGGEMLPADGAALDLPLHSVGAQAQAKPEAELATFLRKRGLFHTDGSFEFFEAVLPEGTTCQIVRHADPQGGPWVIQPAE